MTNLKQYKASSGYGSFFWKSSYCDDGGFKMFCCAFDPNSDHYLRCDQSNVKKAKKLMNSLFHLDVEKNQSPVCYKCY